MKSGDKSGGWGEQRTAAGGTQCRPERGLLAGRFVRDASLMDGSGLSDISLGRSGRDGGAGRKELRKSQSVFSFQSGGAGTFDGFCTYVLGLTDSTAHSDGQATWKM